MRDVWLGYEQQYKDITDFQVIVPVGFLAFGSG